MFTTPTSERIFTSAWDTGYIQRADWLMLLSDVVDEETHLVTARLMHAVRRGRILIVD
jgi:hypothetical protein